ncbi:unnamed protein product [Parnassius apollo]|uniref:(apollo) hypothetical protein n=1 Tax=Parnassius apollo TaxID=110799 RepID=A0A8S3WK80_PARAO|nr:unnamed protein product [Parnassius apollo]
MALERKKGISLSNSQRCTHRLCRESRLRAARLRALSSVGDRACHSGRFQLANCSPCERSLQCKCMYI